MQNTARTSGAKPDKKMASQPTATTPQRQTEQKVANKKRRQRDKHVIDDEHE